jgi:hypothetical protein
MPVQIEEDLLLFDSYKLKRGTVHDVNVLIPPGNQGSHNSPVIVSTQASRGDYQLTAHFHAPDAIRASLVADLLVSAGRYGTISDVTSVGRSAAIPWLCHNRLLSPLAF